MFQTAMLRFSALSVLLLSASFLASPLLTAPSAWAQPARESGLSAGPAADPADVATIDAIITAYYEVVSGPAGALPDVERDLSLHHRDAWVAIAGSGDDGKPTVRVMTLLDFYGDNAPREEAFWEWETDRVISRSGNMVHVWSAYAAAREPRGEPFDTGTNSITLFRDGSRWYIMGWMFDRDAD